MDIFNTKLSINVTDSELCRLCRLGAEFTELFEKDFIKGGITLTQCDLKQVSYILDNIRLIFIKFKKSAMYTDYSLTKNSFDAAEKIIKKLTGYQSKLGTASTAYSLYAIKNKYLNIKAYAEAIADKGDSFAEKTVLIGALRNPHQLKTAIEQEFYHVPASAVENAGNIKCIAIYQSKKLFSHSPGVRYYGKVAAVREIPRYEIKEIPSDSDTMYYRFDIEKWKVLKKPIKADAMGEVATRTTLYQLMTAEKTSELHLSTEEEYKIYKFMKSFAFTQYYGEIRIKNIRLVYDGNAFRVYIQDILKIKITNEDFYKNGVLTAKKVINLSK